MAPSSDQPLHALSFDIEDWFHIVDIPGLEDPAKWPGLESLVERRTDDILAALAAHGVRASFFILGWIADRHPALVARIAEAGHEIGSHSYWHRRVYSLDRDEFRRDTIESLDAIERACGNRPRCYRAPSFSILKGCEWAFDVLAECGIEWDASLFPAPRGHGGYPCGDEPHRVRSAEGREMPELPLSLMRVGGRGLCFSGGGYLRLLPTWLIDRGFRQLERRGIPAVVYLHPRDFAPECPRVPMPVHRRFKCYVGLGSTMAKLEHMLSTRRFGTCGEVLAAAGLAGGGTGGHAA
jgi:polysaccharide deacetylase family protein (PEP-CTERM system associated)